MLLYQAEVVGDEEAPAPLMLRRSSRVPLYLLSFLSGLIALGNAISIAVSAGLTSSIHPMQIVSLVSVTLVCVTFFVALRYSYKHPSQLVLDAAANSISVSYDGICFGAGSPCEFYTLVELDEFPYIVVSSNPVWRVYSIVFLLKGRKRHIVLPLGCEFHEYSQLHTLFHRCCRFDWSGSILIERVCCILRYHSRSEEPIDLDSRTQLEHFVFLRNRKKRIETANALMAKKVDHDSEQIDLKLKHAVSQTESI